MNNSSQVTGNVLHNYVKEYEEAKNNSSPAQKQ
jgi:hypothetical protein